MKKELRNCDDEVYFTVETDAQNGWIRGCWYGIVPIEQIKSASLLYVDCLQRSPYTKILSDIRYLKSSFLDANDWLERVCLAPAVQAGLTSFAYLIPEDFTDKLAVEDFCRRAQGSFRVHIYDNEDDAVEWLKGCK
ncbi:hypothetical protein POKO110462_04400 [Pontibacter korlensis]|uniref:STAS/SEC14 domain-containing protein n=1 Tax=Pontibacter korlensis TaxID=400092 RepID=A0A0E3ZEW7_9BACT|nr:hypothetical protein [Pontibacter korlensis]AKD03219.1 hypothetical protein PKOR_08875 [Pontibacter korlensis]